MQFDGQAKLELKLAGRVALICPSQGEIKFPTSKCLLLLAMLAVEPRTWQRREIANSIWPECSEESARSNLRATLMRTRKALPCDILASDTESVRLRPGAVQVERGNAAQEFMPGYSGRWVEEMRRASVEEDRDRSKEASLHPLISAAQWLLTQNPHEALAMLSQIEHHLLAIPPDQAWALYSEVLAAVPTQSDLRETVEVAGMVVSAMVGDGAFSIPRAVAKFNDAVAGKEFEKAIKLSHAIAVGALSQGHLDFALSYARLNVRFAQLGASSKNAAVRAHNLLANVERHCGLYAQAMQRNERTIQQTQDLGDEAAYSAANLCAVFDYVREGCVLEAESTLEKASSYYCSSHNLYAGPWLQLAHAWIDQACGRHRAAAGRLLEMRENAGQDVDYRARAGAEELLMRSSVDLEDWVEATRAWARHKRILEGRRHIRSLYERDIHRAHRQRLRDKVGASALRTAYSAGASV